MKYNGIDLNKGEQEYCVENYKSLLKNQRRHKQIQLHALFNRWNIQYF